MKLNEYKEIIKESYVECYEHDDYIERESDFQCWMHRLLWERIERRKLNNIGVLTEVSRTKLMSGKSRERRKIDEEGDSKRTDLVIIENGKPVCLIELKYDNKNKFDVEDTKEEIIKLIECNELGIDAKLYCLLLYHVPLQPYKYRTFRKALKRQYDYLKIHEHFSDDASNDDVYSAGKTDSASKLFLICDKDKEV